jgi:predicted DNA-binding transcriptional regulator YafY
MKKVERLIALLYLIKRRHGLRTREIATELGTTERTVYRDIASLNEAFRDYVQIIYTENGYYLDRTIYAPPLRLIGKELEAINALILAQDHVHPHGQVARQALSKMKSAYAESESLDILDLESRLQILAPIPKDRVNPELLISLEEAIQKHQELKLNYYSFNSQAERELIIQPYALALRKHAWYLLAWSESHGKVIQLRAFRIRNHTITGNTFQANPEFSIKQYFANHWSAFQGQSHPITLLFDARTSQLVSELEWHANQELIPQQDGSTLMKLNTSLNPELVSWILGWEGGCVVVEPEELKLKVVSAIQKLAQNYGFMTSPDQNCQTRLLSSE